MKFLWPDIQSTHDAHKACSGASGAAFFVAIITGGLAAAQMSGKINILPGLGPQAFIDAALFVAIGIGLCFHSRIAAVAGLLLYCVERAFMIYTHGFQSSQVFGIVVFGIIFVNGARGAFAWHELTRAELAAASNDPIPLTRPAGSAEPAAPKKKSWLRPFVLTVILVTTAMGAFYYLKTNKEASELYGQLNQKNKQLIHKVIPKAAKKMEAPPAGPTVNLTLKSGRQFKGILMKKNVEGYWLYIEGTGEVFFSPGEVASEN